MSGRPPALTANTWTHLTATYDGTALRIYVNGVQSAQLLAVGSITTSTGALKIGGNSIWPEDFQGLIDEVRIYSRALSQAEIQADMNASVGNPDTQPPTAPTGPRRDGLAQLRSALLERCYGQRRRRALQRAPLDHTGLHAAAANRIAQPTGTSYTDAGLAAGTYYYKVVAEDAAGNASPASNEASATVTGDVVAPNGPVPSPRRQHPAALPCRGRRRPTTWRSVDTTFTARPLPASHLPPRTDRATDGYELHRPRPRGRHVLLPGHCRGRGRQCRRRLAAGERNGDDRSPGGARRGVQLRPRVRDGADGPFRKREQRRHQRPSWIGAGKYGGALTFDGVNDIVNIADANSLDLTTAMTLEAWVRPTALGTNWRTVVFKEQAGHYIYGLYANTGTSRPSANVISGGVDRDLRGASALATNTWSHLAATTMAQR